jgi:uncharacterized membrane protein YfcA
MDHDLLIALCGLVVGFALGLTGGGGSIFAVPLLIYALGVDVRTAVGVSLAAVGATSAFGVLTHLRSGTIDYRIGLIFAVSGMLTTPVGTWIGGRLPPSAVLLGFALLMLFVGVRMWRQPDSEDEELATTGPRKSGFGGREFVRLVGIGFLVGLITGIFGVGGGFIIVPALVLFGGVAIHRAVGTSLLVIALICASGVSSYLVAGDGLPAGLTLVFVAGGCLGMIGGGLLRTRLSGTAMRRTFAVAMAALALFVIGETLWEKRSSIEHPASPSPSETN